VSVFQQRGCHDACGALAQPLLPRAVMRPLAFAQAVYFVATGLWPLVSIRTFQKVTGPKVDLWLVRTVGVLIAAIGATLAVGARRRRPSPETATLALGSAAGLGAIDVVYAARGRISRVYLLDAEAEALLAAAWLAGLARRRR
jgi:hypothetical protein